MNFFSSRHGQRSLLKIAVLWCGVALMFRAQAEPAHPPLNLRREHELLTIHGKLEIQRVDSRQNMYEHQLILDGKSAGVETEYGMVSIAASYPEAGPARLVLLELDSGGSGCPAFFKVLEIKDNGSTTRSKEFGNCSPLAHPSFTDGVLRIDIPKIGGAKAESWRYQNGKLSKLTQTRRK